MGKALCASAGTTARATGTTYDLPGANARYANNATESQSQIPVRVAGTFQYLQVLADASGTARSITFRKNTANGNLVVNPTDTTAGLYIDSTHTDSVSSGDVCDVAFTQTGTPTYFSVAFNFSGTVSHHALYFGNGNTAAGTASTTTYLAPVGLHNSITTTEANAQLKLSAAGTVVNMAVNVITNGRGTATTFGSRLNGAGGNFSISVGAGLTGIFEDTSHTDTIAAGDLYCARMTTGTGAGSIVPENIGFGITYTTSKNDVAASHTTGTTRAAGASSTFYALVGSVTAQASEANAQIQHGFPLTATNARIFIIANTYTGTATLVSRVNGGNGNQTVAIGAGLTGWFEDTTHTDTLGSTDNLCWGLSGGTANSITIATIAVTETDTTTTNPFGWYSISAETQVRRRPALPLASTEAVRPLLPLEVPPSFGWLRSTSENVYGLRAFGQAARFEPVLPPESFLPFGWFAPSSETTYRPTATLQQWLAWAPFEVPADTTPPVGGWMTASSPNVFGLRRFPQTALVAPLFPQERFFPFGWHAPSSGNVRPPKTIYQNERIAPLLPLEPPPPFGWMTSRAENVYPLRTFRQAVVFAPVTLIPDSYPFPGWMQSYANNVYAPRIVNQMSVAFVPIPFEPSAPGVRKPLRTNQHGYSAVWHGTGSFDATPLKDG